ncbi:uncharacterized protein LOC141911743 [Tubulanus polymorphus]|uniref:uncharacterized protein LOC141911743 n=1 Tax=Tubulanus polymorphus TaxID=672921 RepID=UPI003DA43348
MSNEQIKRCRATFDKFDKNGDGRIEASEVAASFKEMGFKPEPGEIEQIIKDGDHNKDGYISWDEIEASLKKRSERQHRTAQQKAELRVNFSLLDADGNGFITEAELQEAGVKAGLTEEEVKRMIIAADKDRDGRVNYNEFMDVM